MSYLSFLSSKKGLSGEDLEINYRMKLNKSKTHFDFIKELLSTTNNNSKIKYLLNVYNIYDLFKTVIDFDSGINNNSCLLTDEYELITKNNKNIYTIVNYENFMERFDKLTHGLLNFFDWNNIVVAGGVINLALSGRDIKELLKSKYDIDMFVYGITEAEAKKIFARVYESFKDIVPDSRCIKTANTITIILPNPYRHIQFVTKLYTSKYDILHSFDLGSSKVLYDGKNVYTTPLGHFAFLHNTNIFTENYLQNSAYESRIYKYAKRGFRILIPNLDKRKVSDSVYKKYRFSQNKDILIKLLNYDKFGKKHEKINNDNSYLLNSIDFSSSNINAYNVIFFVNHSDINYIIKQLKSAINTLMMKMKLTDLNGTTNKPKFFKYHDCTKFPIIKEFKNIKLAFIDNNEYSEKLENTIFINGNIFSKSWNYKLKLNKHNKEFIEKYKKNIEEYLNKNNPYNEIYFKDFYYSDKININELNKNNYEYLFANSNDELLSSDKYGNTFMKRAIDVDNIKAIEYLLSIKFSIYNIIDEGMTYIHYAIKKNKYDIVKIFIKELMQDDKNDVKLYDNARANLIHYVIMYSNVRMFSLFYNSMKIPFSDISWSMQFGSKEKNITKRYSKYTCCAKLCIMYEKPNILQIILNNYKGYNDFRYIFVDSHLKTTNTSDIINFSIKNNSFDILKLLLEFFSNNNIDIYINNIPHPTKYNIECYFLLSKYNNQYTIKKYIINSLANMFNNKKYKEILRYVNKYIPDIWTHNDYNDLHNKIKFKNIFGNEYVDTEKALELFSAIESNNFDKANELKNTLQYDMYIYDAKNKISILSLCENEDKLAILLDMININIYNKMGTYEVNISSLLCINYKFLFNIKNLNTLLENKTHNKGIFEHISKYISNIMNYVYDSCSKKLDYTDFANLLILVTKYKIPVNIHNANNDTIAKENTKKLIKKSYEELESDEDSDEDLIKELELSDDSFIISNNKTLLPNSIIALKNYVNIMSNIKKSCDENIFKNYDYNLFDKEYYIHKINNNDDLKILIKIYPDLLNEYFMLSNKYHIKKNTKLALELLDLYKDNICNHSIYLIYALKEQNYDILVKLKPYIELMISKLNYEEIIYSNIAITKLIDMDINQLIKDKNGNTLLHVIAFNKPSILMSLHEKLNIHNEMNNYNKTPLDYFELSIINSSKFTEGELMVNVKIYNLIKLKLKLVE